MAKVNARNGLLFIDFRFVGQRCREYTKLPDSEKNRKLIDRLSKKIEEEIALGTFNYAATFPGSKMAAKLAGRSSSELRGPDARLDPVTSVAAGSVAAGPSVGNESLLFADFVETWLQEFSVGWRRSHIATVRSTLDRHLVPYFGDQKVGSITKADVLQFRSQLAKVKGRNGNASLAAKTINRTVQLLGQILSEAADRFHFINPVEKVKLRIPTKSATDSD